jgi:hypothetical protein
VLDPVEGRIEVLDERLVLELAGDLDLLGDVVRPAFQAVVGLGPRFVVVEFLQQGVRGFLVVPEVGRGRDFLEVAYFLFSLIDVKDTPVTGPGGG